MNSHFRRLILIGRLLFYWENLSMNREAGADIHNFCAAMILSTGPADLLKFPAIEPKTLFAALSMRFKSVHS